MLNLIKSYWPLIKNFLFDLLKFKKDDIIFKFMGLFLWLYIIRILVNIVFFILLLFF